MIHKPFRKAMLDYVYLKGESVVQIYDSKSECCGCGGCVSICPKHAISMVEDENGFIYPVVDNDVCILCGLCKKICAYQNQLERYEPMEAYVAVSKTTDVSKSASGGVFSALAYSVLKEAGIVYGVTMEEKAGILRPHYIGIERLEDLHLLQGSKYVQSFTDDIFSEIKQYVKVGRKVLFAGTPCQVGELRKFLGQEYDNILLVDIICHGVPSNRFLNDYIEMLESKYHKKIVGFNFRDKTNGWGLNGSVIFYDGKTKFLSTDESSYYTLFLKASIYRESCYTCKYADTRRGGDITIGDYWGVAKQHPDIVSNEVDIKKGVSCLIVNSRKGKNYFDKYALNFQVWKSTFEKVSEYNEQLVRPSKKFVDYDEVMNLYQKEGYAAVDKWYKKKYGPGIMKKLKNRVPYKFKNWLKRICGRNC